MSIQILSKEKNRLKAKRLPHNSKENKLGRGGKHLDNDTKHTIVLYSPDMDFCVSLRMLFQNHFNIVTTTEPDIMMMMVKSFKPDLVIVDSLPTERMQQRFAQMRKEDPGVHIMVFYASSLESTVHHEFIRRLVDAAFSKPIDLAEVMKRVNDFTPCVH